MKIDTEFNQVIEFGEMLTPYAVEIRYPGIIDEELTIDRAKDAVELAMKIKKFVLSRLPVEKEME